MGGDWRELTLEEIARADSYGLVDGPFGSNLPASCYTDSGVPVIRGSNLSKGPARFKADDFVFVSEKTAERLSRSICVPNDVVFTKKGTLGQTGLIPENGILDKYLLSSNQMKLSVNTEIADPLFVYYYVSSPQSIEKILRDSEATGVPKTNITYLKSFPIKLPSLDTQKRISYVLGTLDDKIELNRQMNAILEGMAQALFKSWFVDFDPVIDNALSAGNPIPEAFATRAETRRRALADGTANRDVAKQFPEVFQFTEKMGWIPEGWEVSSIVKQASLTMGQSPSSEYYNRDGNGLPFHQGVTNYGERFPKHEQYSTEGNRYAEQGDILFSVRAPVGRINISDCRIIIGRGLSALRHKKNYQGFLVYFLKHAFQKEDSIGSGTIFNAVNKKEMESFPYIVPVDDLSKTFNNIANSLDEKIADNESQTINLTNLRDTLLPKLISGEIRIPEAEKITEEALA